MTKQVEKGLFDRLTNGIKRNEITQQIKKDHAINQMPVAGFFPRNPVFFSTRFIWICRGSCSGKIYFSANTSVFPVNYYQTNILHSSILRLGDEQRL